MTDEILLFSGWADHWYLLVILLLIIIIVVFIDFLKKDQPRRLLRLLSYLLIGISIAGIILKTKYKTQASKENIILLTDGYHQDILDSLIKINTNAKIYDMRSVDGGSYQTVSDLYDLAYQNSNIEQIELLGVGASHYELEELGKYTVNFYPADKVEGIVDIQFDHTVEVEKLATINVTINRKEKSKIILSINKTKLDSMIVSEQDDFSFRITPKVTGLFIYLLEEYIEDSLVGKYPLPVEVVPQQKLKILFINNFPTFDTKHLRRHLTRRGHQVIIRNRYSQQNFNYEYYNTDDKSAINLASARLTSVDVLLIDHQSLLGLSNKELRNVSLMVKEYGLTVLLQNVEKSTNLSRFKLFDGLSVEESNEGEFVLQKGVSVSKSGFVVSKSSIPITSKSSRNPLGGYQYSGIGKVGILSFQNSYELVLDGYQDLYRSVWLDIFEQVAKRHEVGLKIDFEENLPIVDSPLIVHFENNTNQEYQVRVGGLALALKQDVQLPNRWTGKYWASTSGWHSLFVDSTTVSNRYVFNKPDWSSLISHRKIQNTHLLVKQKQQKIKEPVKYTYRKISPVIFYIIFLISIAYLWVEAKL